MLAPIPPCTGSPGRRTTADRRRHTRVTPNRPSLCRIQAVPVGTPVAAFVHNLSASGVALFSEGPFTVGSEVRLALVNNAAIYCLIVSVTVLRCQPSPAGDWFIAGMFDRLLTPAELGPFVV